MFQKCSSIGIIYLQNAPSLKDGVAKSKKTSRMKNKALIILPFFVLIFAVSMTIAEPETFETMLDALWWISATLTTVGYGDIYPHSPLGRALGMVLMFSGIGFFALLLKELTSTTMNIALRKQHGDFIYKKKGHILICCNNTNIINAIIDEYLKDFSKDNTHFIVLSDSEVSPVKDIKYKNVFWMKGNSHDLHTISKANGAEAKMAYIYLEDDSDVILTCLQLEKVSDGDIITVVKCNKKENVEYLKSIDADFIFSPGEIEVPLMVSLLSDEGAGEWAMSLISKSKNTPSLYNVGCDDEDVGKKWGAVVTRHIKEKHNHPVAILRDGKTIHDPSLDDKIEKGDQYLVVSKKRPQKNLPKKRRDSLVKKTAAKLKSKKTTKAKK